MADQWGKHPSADVRKTVGLGNRVEEFTLHKRSRLLRHLAALIAAVAVIISTGAFEPSLLAANPPHPHPSGGPSPQQIQQHLQEQHRKEQLMLQEWLRQQRAYQQHLQRLREEYQKKLRQRMMEQAPLHNGGKPGPTPPIKPATAPPSKRGPESRAKGGQASQGNPGTNLPYPVITGKQFPFRKDACGDLIQALRHMHAAAEFHAESREVALESIREALRRFGETPTLAAPNHKKDHLRWAETNLRDAHKRMFDAWYLGSPRSLQPELWVPVLAEIHKAMFSLRHPGLEFPDLEQVRHELVEAMHLVHAADGLHVRPKGKALMNVRKALYVLGKVPPVPSAPDQKSDHIRLAEGHVRTAYKAVLEARLLPPEMRAPVLSEIYYAIFVLTHPNPAIPFPSMKETIRELDLAWRELLSVPGMDVELRELALTSIGETIIVLGATLPGRWESRNEGDHFKLADEHLRKANEYVVSKQHLPQELRKRLLEEIERATVVLKHTAIPGGGVAAPK